MRLAIYMLLGISALGVGACEKFVSNKGHVFLEDSLRGIHCHTSHQEDVLKRLGPPSIQETIHGAPVWFYGFQKFVREGPFKEKPCQYHMVALFFTPQGELTRIKVIDKLTSIQMDKERTPFDSKEEGIGLSEALKNYRPYPGNTP